MTTPARSTRVLPTNELLAAADQLLNPPDDTALSPGVRARAAATLLRLALDETIDAFWRSAVMLQLREPFRLDSLSFTRELLQFGVPVDKQGAMAVSLTAGLAGIGLAWWRAPRTPAGFAVSLGVTCFLLTAFGKKAFLNYYFLVVAFLLVAVAAASRPAVRRS